MFFHVLRFASDETYNACEYAHQKQEHESVQVIIVINCTECLAVLGYTVKIPVIRSIYQTINAEKSADWGKDHTGDIFQNIEDYFTRLIFKDSGFFHCLFSPQKSRILTMYLKNNNEKEIKLWVCMTH